MTVPHAATVTLPEGMALRETAEGRWLPACAPLEKLPSVVAGRAKPSSR